MPDNIFWIGNRHTFDVSLARNLSIDSHFKCQFFAYLTHCCKILQNFVWHTDVSFLGKQGPFGWITTQWKYTKIVTECPRNFFHFIADHLNVSHNFFMNAFLLLHVDDQFDKKKICGLIETKYVINIWRQKPSEIKWKT